MRWLNPVALVGLLALAVPILVHLFGRRVARRQRFPSLRFLRLAQPTPATRSRPSDLLLLVVRCLTILAAVAALAQPRWSDTAKRALVRAILIDTSASMRRLTSDGTNALEGARAMAQRMLDSASEGLVMETGRPGSNVAGATSWLSRRSGMRELIVISDFQAGSIHEGNLVPVDSGIGTRMIRIGSAGAAEAIDTIDGVRIEASAGRTIATWPMAVPDPTATITVLAADDDRDAVRASIAAVRSLSPRAAATTRKASLVFAGAPTLRELVAQAVPIDSAWQGDLVLALARDPVLASLAEEASPVAGCEGNGSVVARNARSATIATVARIASTIVVFACVEPGSLAGTALIASVESALGAPPAMEELEPSFLPDETLRRWERPAIDAAPRGPEETSPDGRWFWLLALGFLVAEEWLRRRMPRRKGPVVNEVPNERVA